MGPIVTYLTAMYNILFENFHFFKDNIAEKIKMAIAINLKILFMWYMYVFRQKKLENFQVKRTVVAIFNNKVLLKNC